MALGAVEVQGETLVVTIVQGQLRVPRAQLKEPSLSRFFPALPAPLIPAAPHMEAAIITTTAPLPAIREDAQFVRLQETMAEWKTELPPPPQYPGTEEHPLKWISGNFNLPSRVKGNPVIPVVYRVPVDMAGKPLPSAAQMVFFAPYPGEKNGLGRKDQLHLSEWLGMTVLAFQRRWMPRIMITARMVFIILSPGQAMWCGWHKNKFKKSSDGRSENCSSAVCPAGDAWPSS